MLCADLPNLGDVSNQKVVLQSCGLFNSDGVMNISETITDYKK